MSRYVPQAAPFIFGALFLGFWLIWTMFEDAGWGIWGVIGIGIAGALYAARVTNDYGRIIVWSIIGISLAALIYAMIRLESPDFIATFITLFGAALIVSALPRPGQTVSTSPPPTVRRE